jgi:hypothetical protein
MLDRGQWKSLASAYSPRHRDATAIERSAFSSSSSLPRALRPERHTPSFICQGHHFPDLTPTLRGPRQHAKRIDPAQAIVGGLTLIARLIQELHGQLLRQVRVARTKRGQRIFVVAHDAY